MFAAYFDESGHHTSDVVTVAGVVASVEAWARFARRWQRELNRVGVTTFRMSQYENRVGEFADLDDRARQSLIANLVGILKDVLVVAVSQSIVIDDFRRIVMPSLPGINVHRDPYFWCLQVCLEDIAKYSPHWKREQISCVFEENERGAIKDYYVSLKRVKGWDPLFGSFVFAPKDGPGALLPLQAADMIAYESLKYFRNERLTEESKRPIRKLLKALGDSQRLGVNMLDSENLPDAVANIRATTQRLLETGQL